MTKTKAIKNPRILKCICGKEVKVCRYIGDIYKCDKCRKEEKLAIKPKNSV